MVKIANSYRTIWKWSSQDLVHAHATHMDRIVAFKQLYLARNSERQFLMYLMDKKVHYDISK